MVMSLNETDRDLFLQLRRLVDVAHHVPGRIRVKASLSLARDYDDVDPRLIQRIAGELAGIEDIRVNAMAGSVVINYDAEVIKPTWWDTLISGEESRAAALLETLLATNLGPVVDAVRAR